MSNWFKVHRDIFDSDIWRDVTTFRLFILLIGKATHQDGITVAGIELKRGQYLRSYRKLADDLAYKEGRGTKEYSTRTIKKCIDKLIKAERVSKEETEQGTLFTILNYSKYQGFRGDKKETVNSSVNEPETFGKRSVNNNKNAKNEKELSSSSMVDSDLKEVIQFYQSNLQAGLTESPHNQNTLLDLYDTWNKDLLIAAMKLAAEQEKKGVAFLKGILNNWKEAGVQTLEDARKYEKDFRNNMKNSKVTPINRRKTAGEIDWDNL